VYLDSTFVFLLVNNLLLFGPDNYILLKDCNFASE